MAEPPSPQDALAHISATLRDLGRDFALVGGLAVSLRAEVRFTRDVDIAVVSATDDDAESLIHTLRGTGYQPVATVENEQHHRLATARLGTASGPRGRTVVGRRPPRLRSRRMSDGHALSRGPGRMTASGPDHWHGCQRAPPLWSSVVTGVGFEPSGPAR
jgi:hypothetical protein